MFKMIKNVVFSVVLASLIPCVIKNKFIWGLICGWLLILLLFATYRGHEGEFAPSLQPLALQTAVRVASEIPDAETSGIESVYVFPFTGPNGSIMADYVRESVKGTNKVSVFGSGIIENSLRFANIDLPKLTPDKALEYGKKMGVAGVITGKIMKINAITDPPELAVEVALTSVAEPSKTWVLKTQITSAENKKKTVFNQSEIGRKGDTAEVADALSYRMISIVADKKDETSAIEWKFFILISIGYALISLLTPLVLYPLTRYLLSNESNLSNVVMLVLYALINIVVLGFVVVINPLTVLGGVLILVCFVISLWLNYLTCSVLERLSV